MGGILGGSKKPDTSALDAARAAQEAQAKRLQEQQDRTDTALRSRRSAIIASRLGRRQLLSGDETGVSATLGGSATGA